MMEKDCPEESSAAASEGTLLHASMEQLLAGAPLDEGALTDEQRDACARALEMLEGVKGTIMEERPDAVFRLISTEERAFYEDFRGNDLYSGQWDALFSVDCKDESYFLVIDWKFGRVEVDSAEANRQLEALVTLLPRTARHKGSYAAVIQPRISGRASVAFYDLQSIGKAEERTVAVARAAMAPDAPLHASEKACLNCKAKASCRALAGAVEAASGVTLRGSWEQWTPGKRVEAYELAKMARKWADAVERRFERDVDAGLIPGYEKGPGRKSFVVSDPAGAFSALQASSGMPAADFTQCCRVSITELDKLVHATRKMADPRATTKASRDWLRQVLAPYGEEKTTKGSVRKVQKAVETK